MQIQGYTVGLGALIALIVLVVALILWLTGHPFTDDEGYGFAAALAVARLVP